RDGQRIRGVGWRSIWQSALVATTDLSILGMYLCHRFHLDAWAGESVCASTFGHADRMPGPAAVPGGRLVAGDGHLHQGDPCFSPHCAPLVERSALPGR